jgi:hypothetical protein
VERLCQVGKLGLASSLSLARRQLLSSRRQGPGVKTERPQRSEDERS